MSIKYNLEGKRFGRLVVQSRAKEVYYNRCRVWLCICDCGKEKFATSTDLISGDVKSCGCLLKKNGRKVQLNKEETIFHFILNLYKYSAKKRNIEFLLSVDDVRNLVTTVCYYCGRMKNEISFSRMGIDRLNNDDGYNMQNCVPCCGDCNKAKGTRTKTEFLNWIEMIYKIHRNK